MAAGNVIGPCTRVFIKATFKAAYKAWLPCMRVGPSSAVRQRNIVLHVEVRSLEIDVERHSKGCRCGIPSRVGWPVGIQIL